MSMQPKSWAAWCAVLAVSMCGAASAQCERDWKQTDGYPGLEFLAGAFGVTSWDPDGAGPLAPRVVVGGGFEIFADKLANAVAALDPETGEWEDVGGGVSPGFPNVMTTFEDDLIVAGGFTSAGGVPATNIARWNGTSWSALGSGIPGAPIAMTVYNGELIVAGSFATAGGVTVNNIARWNGVSWQPLGNPAGVNGTVFSLAVYDGELFAVGLFTTAGHVPASRIARWNGTQWQSVGTGMNNGTFALAVVGDDLYVGGNASSAGGVPMPNGMARWDGTSFHTVPGLAFGGVNDLAFFQGDLIVSGSFQVFAPDGHARHIVRLDLDTQTWHTMEGGFNQGGIPSALAVHGDDLYAVGQFMKAGTTTLQGVARWSGAEQTWKKVAPGFTTTPNNFTSYRGDLIAAGSFGSAGDAEAMSIARWDGQDWHAMGSGISDGVVTGSMECLLVYDDRLIAGGHFGTAGGVDVDNLAAWDGDTESWSNFGGGVVGGAVPRVNALAIYDGDLIAGGDFDFAGGVPAFNIARWDGKEWHAMDAGVGVVRSMAEFEGELYVSVSTGLNGMQRWDGNDWHAVPDGPNGNSMVVWKGQLISGFADPLAYDGETWTVLPGWSFEVGTGFLEYVLFEGDLLIGGGFQDAGGNPDADGFVRFDGTTWHAMGTDTGTIAGGMSAGWVHKGELITNGGVFHSDGSFSSWRRFGWPWSDIGSGLAGVNGKPVLAGTGGMAAGCTGTLSLTSARPLAPAVLFASLSSAPVPFKGGVLVAFPFFLTVPLFTNGSGAIPLNYTWPSGIPGGTALTLQYAVQDPAAVQGVSLSNALQGETP